jgi:hypothetical protein
MLSSNVEIDDREIKILKKIQSLDRLTSREKGELINLIINNYVKYERPNTDAQNFNNKLKYITDVINEEQFREFTFNFYKIFIYYESKTKLAYIVRVRDEILSAIKNRDTLDDNRLLDQIIQIARSSFNDKLGQGFYGYISGVVSLLPLALYNGTFSF